MSKYNFREIYFYGYKQSGGEEGLDFRNSDLAKNPDGTDIKPLGEFWWSLEGPLSQIHSSPPHGAPGVFSDLSRSVKMLKREWYVEAMGSYRTYSIPGKTAALVLEFAVEDLPLAELHPWLLRL